MTELDENEAGRIKLIRAAVWQYVESGSLRRAAREIGMSPTGVSNFLHGSTPGNQTLQKLTLWYDQRR